MLSIGTEQMTVRVLGISGSGRNGSFNTALLKAARGFLPEGVTLEPYDVSHFPLYGPDSERNMPPNVIKFKEKLQGADAVIISTPEYNHSIPAMLKNAIEWGNRPYGDNSWDGKPAAIISASTSPTGGARAQEHLRQIMVDLNMFPLNKPQVLVGRAQEKFSSSLELTDQKTQELLRDLLAQLVERARVLKEISHQQQILVMA